MSPDLREECRAYARELAQAQPPISDAVAAQAAHILAHATTAHDHQQESA